MTNASTGGSVTTMEVDNVFDSCEGIAKNQANWLTEMGLPKESSMYT